MKSSSENANCVIDIESLEGTCGGLVSLYATPAATAMASTILHSHLNSQFDSLLTLLSLLASKKGKVFPYSLPSVGPGADPGVQAVSPLVT